MAYRPGPFALALMGLIVVFLLVPLVAVVPISFTPSEYLALPQGAYSLRHYRALVDDPAWGNSALLSLWVGIVASALATTLATAFGIGLWFLQPRLTRLLVGFVIMPMVVPPVISAVTLYFMLTSLSKFAGAIGYDTWPGVVIAHIVMISPFAVVMVLVALSRLDRRIDMAARSCGASVPRRIFSVILPNIRFGVATAAFLSFILSWEEIAVTLFITSTKAITLPRLVWSGLRDNVDPAIAALSVLLILVTIVLMVVITVVRARADRKPAH
ncbi:ABC transporter permease [Pararhizobium mangrovi]|uniref:ABC transporter permease n=1 Tax=Pararhizobium mangrovi TaxID=2590452 RepID=A0A506UC23_9HYPH|nr:ABC transporter permease [Pararhizobium mangrovi]TPW31973.1 ABC transporter permease [Pararhizobium mangrovi]